MVIRDSVAVRAGNLLDRLMSKRITAGIGYVEIDFDLLDEITGMIDTMSLQLREERFRSAELENDLKRTKRSLSAAKGRLTRVKNIREENGSDESSGRASRNA